MSEMLYGDPFLGVHPTRRVTAHAELRANRPVYRSRLHAGWLVTRYADVNEILRDPDVLALDVIPFLTAFCERGGMDLSALLGFYGSFSWLTRPPRHDALRRLLAEALNGIRKFDLAGMLDRKADELLEAGVAAGGIDLAGGFGRKLALFVIGSFFGVPPEDLPKLSALAAEFSFVFEWFLPSVGALRRLEACGRTLTAYFFDLLADRRANPGADGISLLVRLADAQLDASPEDLARYCVTFFLIAEETTAAGISGALRMLLEAPALQEKLRAEPSLVPEAAREMLRLVTPLQYVARQLPADTELHGETIRAGDPVLLMLGAANRDPAVFERPDELVFGRGGPEPLMFGAGAYRCIGAQLANFEVEFAIRKVLQRPGLRLAGAPEWSARTNVVPLTKLPASFE